MPSAVNCSAMWDIEIAVTAGACFALAGALLLLPLNWLFAGLFAAAFHELCHVLCVAVCGGQVSAFRIRLGGAELETTPLSPVKSLICAAGGPIGSLLLLLLWRRFPRVSLCALAQGLFNLLPMLPLDGGWIVSSLTSLCFSDRTARRITSAVGTLCGLLLFTLCLWLWFTQGFGILCMLPILLVTARACLQKKVANRGFSRYNRATYEKRVAYDRAEAANSANRAKARPLHRR